MTNAIFKIFFITILFTSNIYSQNQVLSLGGGIAIVVGEGSDYINTGFNGLFTGLMKTSNNLYIGGKIGYNRFGIDDDLYGGIESYYNVDLSASMSILEIVPLIRFMPPNNGYNSTSFFIQGGLGLYMMKISATASYQGQSATESESNSEVGMSLGLGLVIGQENSTRFEIVPNFNMIFTEGESTEYLNITLGIIF